MHEDSHALLILTFIYMAISIVHTAKGLHIQLCKLVSLMFHGSPIFLNFSYSVEKLGTRQQGSRV